MEAEDPPITVEYSGVEAQPGPRAARSCLDLAIPPDYDTGWFRPDIIAGLTLWGSWSPRELPMPNWPERRFRRGSTHSLDPLSSTQSWEQPDRRSLPRPQGPRS